VLNQDRLDDLRAQVFPGALTAYTQAVAAVQKRRTGSGIMSMPMHHRGHVPIHQGGPDSVAEIVGVVFHGGIKVYHFDPAGLELERGDRVVVQTSSGPRSAGSWSRPHHRRLRVARAAEEGGARGYRQGSGEPSGSRGPTPPGDGHLPGDDPQHGLDMKLVGADIGFGGEKITFSFTSEERVDFRGLVADLAKALKMRIELRQVVPAKRRAWWADWDRAAGGSAAPCSRVTMIRCPSAWPRSRICPSIP